MWCKEIALGLVVGGWDLRLESDNPGLGDDLLPTKISREAAIEIGLGCELEIHHCSCYCNAVYYCEESDKHCHYGVAMDLRVENDNQVSSECKAGRKMVENLARFVCQGNGLQYDDLKTQNVSRSIVIDCYPLGVGCVETIAIDPVEGVVG